MVTWGDGGDGGAKVSAFPKAGRADPPLRAREGQAGRSRRRPRSVGMSRCSGVDMVTWGDGGDGGAKVSAFPKAGRADPPLRAREGQAGRSRRRPRSVGMSRCSGVDMVTWGDGGDGGAKVSAFPKAGRADPPLRAREGQAGRSRRRPRSVGMSRCSGVDMVTWGDGGDGGARRSPRFSKSWGRARTTTLPLRETDVCGADA